MQPQQPPSDSDSAADPKSTEIPTRKLSLGKKLAFLMFVLVFLFFCLEGLLIVLQVSFPLLYQPDEYCASRLKPNLNVRYREEGNAVVQTNSAGFRDVEWKKENPGGVVRIALVGDSFCEAIQVAREDSVSYRLEAMLQATGITAEVMNFGISGFGTAQSYEMLNHYVADYQPDLVVLLVFLGNDVGDNSRTINPGQLKPYYDLIDGDLVLDRGFTQDPLFIAGKSRSTQLKASLINSSRCLQLLNKFYAGWKSGSRSRANVGIGLDPELYQPPRTEEWKQAWAVTEALLSAFDDKCAAIDSKCLVVTLSNPIQVHPDQSVRDDFAEQHAIDSLFYPDERIAAYCEKHKIELLQLSKPFLETVRSADEPLFLHGFSNTELGTGHWNEQGHQLAAELIGKRLLEWVKSD